MTRARTIDTSAINVTWARACCDARRDRRSASARRARSISLAMRSATRPISAKSSRLNERFSGDPSSRMPVRPPSSASGTRWRPRSFGPVTSSESTTVPTIRGEVSVADSTRSSSEPSPESRTATHRVRRLVAARLTSSSSTSDKWISSSASSAECTTGCRAFSARMKARSLRRRWTISRTSRTLRSNALVARLTTAVVGNWESLTADAVKKIDATRASAPTMAKIAVISRTLRRPEPCGSTPQQGRALLGRCAPAAMGEPLSR
jgi:hypothetical protein